MQSQQTPQQDLEAFIWRNEISPRLERLRSVADMILATSINSERAFSSAGSFCTKLRTRMSSELLDALVFLKNYFISHSC